MQKFQVGDLVRHYSYGECMLMCIGYAREGRFLIFSTIHKYGYHYAIVDVNEDELELV